MKFEPSDWETAEVKPVKVGESPGAMSGDASPSSTEPTPSQARKRTLQPEVQRACEEGVESRRRAPKARPISWSSAQARRRAAVGKARVKACSRPRTGGCASGPRRRRKPKWEENPSTSRSCRFDSGLGHQLADPVSKWHAFAESARRIMHFSDTGKAPFQEGSSIRIMGFSFLTGAFRLSGSALGAGLGHHNTDKGARYVPL